METKRISVDNFALPKGFWSELIKPHDKLPTGEVRTVLQKDKQVYEKRLRLIRMKVSYYQTKADKRKVREVEHALHLLQDANKKQPGDIILAEQNIIRYEEYLSDKQAKTKKIMVNLVKF